MTENIGLGEQTLWKRLELLLPKTTDHRCNRCWHVLVGHLPVTDRIGAARKCAQCSCAWKVIEQSGEELEDDF